jgi:hypothetical protein
MDKDELVRLAERVEAATGDSFDLNHAIARALGIASEPFTASLDAAMTLVPEGCKWGFDGHWNIARIYSYEYQTNRGQYPIYEAEAATPALALCAAALRARSPEGGTDV